MVDVSNPLVKAPATTTPTDIGWEYALKLGNNTTDASAANLKCDMCSRDAASQRVVPDGFRGRLHGAQFEPLSGHGGVRPLELKSRRVLRSDSRGRHTSSGSTPGSHR